MVISERIDEVLARCTGGIAIVRTVVLTTKSYIDGLVEITMSQCVSLRLETAGGIGAKMEGDSAWG